MTAARETWVSDCGRATLHLGDCREIVPTLPRPDAIVTDPPYGVLSETGSAATRRSGRNPNAGIMSWDIAPDADFVATLRQCADVQMFWGGCHLRLPPTLGYLVWDKQIDGLNFGEVEFCWTSERFAPRIFRHRAVGIDGGKEHPTQKPVALMAWCLDQARIKPGQTVLDPYMGSGTTGVACMRRNVRFVGIEIEPRYFEVAKRRIAEAARQPDLLLADAPRPAASQSAML